MKSSKTSAAVKAARQHEKQKFLLRVDSCPPYDLHGYQVRRTLDDGRTVGRFFSDSTHGGTNGAYHAALAYRDRLEAAFGMPRTDRRVVMFNQRNTTGKIGVTIDQSHDRYIVHWSPKPGESQSHHFKFGDYGGQMGALAAAVAYRESRELQVYGGIPDPIQYLRTANMLPPHLPKRQRAALERVYQQELYIKSLPNTVRLHMDERRVVWIQADVAQPMLDKRIIRLFEAVVAVKKGREWYLDGYRITREGLDLYHRVCEREKLGI
jgi:hypothetical protein